MAKANQLQAVAKLILVATLLLTACSGPAPAPTPDYGAKLRKECASVWREIKDSSEAESTVKNYGDARAEENWIVTCIIRRATNLRE